MKAILRASPGKIIIVDKQDPIPAAGEVIVRVTHAGICGSDSHRFADSNPKWNTLILGHEFSGTIAAIAENVMGYNIGDRVCAAPLLPCHVCGHCARGNFSLCERYSFIGSRIDGCFAEYVKVPAVNIIPLGHDFPLERGAFIEPLTVCLHPIMRLGSLLGKTIAVTGLGTIGLLAVQVFRAMGARLIIAVDIIPEKLELALRIGATHAVDGSNESLEDIVRSKGGAHIVFESSGNNAAKLNALRMTRGKGKIIQVGTSPQDITYDAALFERITRKEICIIGSWMNYSAPWPGDEWATAVWMLRSGLIETECLITHRFRLTDFQEALNTVLGSEGSPIKVMITGEEDSV
ncbi:MAG: hypothetical protein B6D68_00730 [spirochete symbiont of Stewartia floridana]|nr:MAG: hypothetical protein B6D68_00730 [spirochete symbiont of Stewartia floridana]